ncbi:hypothetical protein Scep_008737 [Stephania cephalantha]|uniref:Helitron helicase-like domain-containing protein n=1 Tax=Stephania cephalantha TaxID=152367 RepID=A0AAP0JRS5_9MAGN
MYVKLESSRLDYIRLNQKQIRAELYQGIIDSIEISERNGSQIGRRVILPASFIGGPRDMRKRYMDAMSLVQRFGKPDIFLTMTCNPKWKEIKNELRFNDEAQNRPDLTSRIFRAKLEELKKDILKKKIFGPVAAYVYVVEFQKRGLPHAHFLIVLEPNSKISDPSTFDRYVCAEIPNKAKYRHLNELVIKHMMHGPCGTLNPKNICMLVEGKCKNHYPKQFCEYTCHDIDSYPQYRRRNDGKVEKVRGSDLDNRWVVPYNPYLLSKYDCHLNVEICSTIKAVKYLYKYIYKGHDRIAFEVRSENVNNHIDEIEKFQSARWVSAPEAMWRMYSFPLNEIYPSVITLQLHLDGKQIVSFGDCDMLEDVVNSDMKCASMLTEYFALNKVDEFARSLLYRQIPEYYVWNRQSKTWKRRKQGNVIGRIVSVSPNEGERYYLRLLLNHIKGCTSFQELKIVNGVVADSFHQAALLNRFLEADDCLESCMEEACKYQMPFALRRLFVTILSFCNPESGRQLWGNFKEQMCEDYVHLNLNIDTAEKKALKHVNEMLLAIGKSLAAFNIQYELFNVEPGVNDMLEINEELEIKASDDDVKIIKMLNEL